MTAGFGPVADYLPHRPPMLLIDEIVEVSELRAVCRTTIHPDCVFAIDGVVHPSAMIEVVAQTCAIFAGVRGARDGNPPRLGLLIACREVELAVDRFVIGDVLTIVANRVFGDDQLAAFTATVLRGELVCVTVELSVVDAALAAAPRAAGADG